MKFVQDMIMLDRTETGGFRLLRAIGSNSFSWLHRQPAGH